MYNPDNSIFPVEIDNNNLDPANLDQFKAIIAQAQTRLHFAEEIRDNESIIIKNAISKLELYPDVINPNNDIKLNQIHSACIRDLQYFLRYATYAMVAENFVILDERVLNGLKETYISLDVNISATVQAIQSLKDFTTSLIGTDAGKELGIYLDYICDGLIDSSPKKDQNDPIVGLFAGASNLAEKSEEILQYNTRQYSGWTWKEP